MSFKRKGMNNMENNINDLMENEEFAEQLKNVTSIEGAVALFASKGVSVTAEELTGYMGDGASDDLSEDDLDAVSGGLAIGIGFRIVAAYLRWKAKR